MISLNADFLAALEAGSGKPIFYITLAELSVDPVSVKATYNVTEAYLSRSKVEVRVKENLLATGLVDIITGSKWVIKVTRGLTLGSTDYVVSTLYYYISYITYSEPEGTFIVAELLPSKPLAPINSNQTVTNLLTAVFTQWNCPSTIVFDATRDIFYGWVWGKLGSYINLYDGRLLEGLVQEKYFAWLFPRANGINVYSVCSNMSNNEDGTYTPFAHAKVEYFLSVDKVISLSWSDGTTITQSDQTEPALYGNLGYIDVDPTLEAEFEDWLEIFSGNLLQYTQRPDLRLEQGDLLKVSTDGGIATRCFEIYEYFKIGANPSWRQVVRQLPNHPYAFESYDPPGGKLPDIPQPADFRTNILGSTFSGALLFDNADLHQALKALDGHDHSAVYAPIAKGVTNGDTHDHAGGDGAQVDHGGLAGLADDDHTQYIKHSLRTAGDDFLVGDSGPGGSTFLKKTLAEVKTILGLGSAAYTASTDYAVTAKGVTNGDSHAHNSGDGSQISYANLSNTPNVLRLAGCWVRATANSTTILESYNVDSVVDSATGRMQVVIATDFAADTYAPLLTLKTLNSTTVALVPAVVTVTAAACTIDSWDVGTSPYAKVDPESWALAIFGA